MIESVGYLNFKSEVFGLLDYELDDDDNDDKFGGFADDYDESSDDIRKLKLNLGE